MQQSLCSSRISRVEAIRSAAPSLSNTPTPTIASFKPKAADIPAIPWRRTNVRHTSNELYVDIVETLSVTTAPSGRPLAARANGSIAMNCKVSGIPDLLLLLTCPGGKMNIENTMQLPVFHPCVRLARWKERPGELSFVPPDGRFVLAGYEVDLLGKDYLEQSFANPKSKPDLRIPANIEVRAGLGDAAADFEVRLTLNPSFSCPASKGGAGGGGSGFAQTTGLGGRATSGTTASPTLDNLLITVPVPSSVRNLADLRATRGEATYSPGDGSVEWRIVPKDLGALSHAPITLRCTVVGPLSEEDNNEHGTGLEGRTDTWDYDDTAAYPLPKEDAASKSQTNEDRAERRRRQNALLMPSSAAVSFSVKGWLASGIRVEKLLIDARRSRGLGRGVEPYKGVKYLTVSRKGVEARC